MEYRSTRLDRALLTPNQRKREVPSPSESRIPLPWPAQGAAFGRRVRQRPYGQLSQPSGCLDIGREIVEFAEQDSSAGEQALDVIGSV